MTTQELIITAWHLTPISIATAVLGTLATAFAIWKKGRSTAPKLIAALCIFLFTIISPLGTLSEGYLFSAHMIHHLLLLLIVPLFVVIAIPGGKNLHTKPWRAIGWISGVGAMWLWHEPSLCSLAAVSPAMQATQTITLLIAGYLFWRPIMGTTRLHPAGALLYLFSACTACTLLGIYVAFVPISVCPAFAAASQSSPIIILIRDGWGFSAAADQQVGGLLMWIPACLIYFTAILARFLSWHEPQNTVSK